MWLGDFYRCVIQASEAACGTTSSCWVCLVPGALAVPVLSAFPSGKSLLCLFYCICSALKIREQDLNKF